MPRDTSGQSKMIFPRPVNGYTAANSPTGTIADSDTFTFDRAGRMLTAVNGRYSNTVTYTFDPIGRKATEALTIGGQTYTITSEYNSRGELTKVTYPDSSISERTYHATGALNQLKLDGSTISTRTYDDGRRLTGETLGNGVTESRTYASDNLLTAISYGGTGTSIGNLSYTWDSNKNKTSETIGGTMSNYGFTSAGTSYDDEDRLTGFARASGTFTQSWSLTSVGDWNSITTNGTAQNRTHGPTHELLTAGGQNVTTDVKGNITLLPTTLTTSGVAMAVGYDFDNKLKSADVDNNGSNDVTFQYDALGRRVARQGTSGSFVYVQHDQQTIADYGYGDAPSSPTHRYVYASYIDEPVVRKAAGTSGTIHYYHRNQQYSITAVTTSSGSVAERYAYTAYGQPTILDGSGSVLSSSAINNRYTYTGREWDQTLGLYHFRARWTSGLAGRFMGRDPIGYEGSEWGLYECLDASPLEKIDALGLSTSQEFVQGLLGFVDSFSPRGGIRQCIRVCTRIGTTPSCVCLTVCGEADVRKCCTPDKECCSSGGFARKICNVNRIEVEVGLYACETLGGRGGFVPPFPAVQVAQVPAAFNQGTKGKWRPKRPGGPIAGVSEGCPKEGWSGSVCITASAGFSSWTYGARGCYDFGSETTTFDTGLGVGVGTGVSGGGGGTYTVCPVKAGCCVR